MSALGISPELGGRGRIRTHEALTSFSVFRTAAISRSATLPKESRPRIAPERQKDTSRPAGEALVRFVR